MSAADPTHPVVVALGSNLGDREATLRSATQALARTPGVSLRAVSGVWQTPAVGGPPQPDYLNAVVLLDCTLEPAELLARCQQIEHEHQRRREVRWGPRTLDLDLITFGTVRSTDPELEVPHPRAASRAFVLAPWAQVDPDGELLGHPVAELLRMAADRDDVELTDIRLTAPLPRDERHPG